MSSDFLIKNISSVDPTLYEEDSYEFLSFYQTYKDWIVYDSFVNDFEDIYLLTQNFINFHGKISFPEDLKIHDSYWSVYPLGVFKYKMLDNGLPYHITPKNNKPGYIVIGMFWFNGFFYVVKDEQKIVQIKLFIDSDTKNYYSYPDL
jgi:hypothetical protein